MLSSGILYFDLTTLLKVLLTAFIVGVAAVRVVRDTASKHLIVGRFGDGAYSEADQSEATRCVMATEEVVEDVCFVCRSPTTKKCARCKAVRYCSPSCQKQDWNAGHNVKCKPAMTQSDRSLTNAVFGKVKSITRTDGPCGADSLSAASRTCKVLFPYNEFVELFNWDKPGLPPCGLVNCGNSCFANVILQCLASTRPLVAYFVERDHSKECSRNGWCFLCELQTHVHRVRQSLHPFSPINILSRIPNIGGNLGYWKQEDAHEFMRFAIDTMQSVCLDEFGGEKVIEPSIQETTLIHHIFGGHLQSQVICSSCDKVSNRYEKMMDLTVEIQGDAESLEECLQQFTAREWLDGENMYKCDGCSAYVKAWKRLTVHQAPNVLTIALKRFQSGRFGKLNKRVTFPEALDLCTYMSELGESTNFYKLYAVVVHVDMLNASFFGHYICYTKDIQGTWYRIDDCKVMKVELDEVLSQRAYMLLYSRVHVRPAIQKHLEGLNKVHEQPIRTEEIQNSTVNFVSMIRPELATSLGSSISDLSRKPQVLNLKEESDFEVNHTVRKEDLAKEPFSHTRANVVDPCAPSSKNGTMPPEDSQSIKACDISSSSFETSNSIHGEADSSVDANVLFQKEKCTVSNGKLGLFECPNGSFATDSVLSKHANGTPLDCGQLKDSDSSVDGITHASVSPTESSREVPITASCQSFVSIAEEHPSMYKTLENGIAGNGRICSDEIMDDSPFSSPKESLSARYVGGIHVPLPFMCKKVDNGIIANGKDCSNEIAADCPLLSPKESVLRPLRRPKPVFSPGFLNKAGKKTVANAR